MRVTGSACAPWYWAAHAGSLPVVQDLIRQGAGAGQLSWVCFPETVAGPIPESTMSARKAMALPKPPTPSGVRTRYSVGVAPRARVADLLFGVTCVQSPLRSSRDLRDTRSTT